MFPCYGHTCWLHNKLSYISFEKKKKEMIGDATTYRSKDFLCPRLEFSKGSNMCRGDSHVGRSAVGTEVRELGAVSGVLTVCQTLAIPS